MKSSNSVCILSVGNEILNGRTLNSNSHFLSRQLTDSGFDVCAHSACKDEPNSLELAIKEGFNKASVVIATGGLGPTLDDVTKLIATKTMQTELVLDHNLFQQLKERFPKAASLKDQATIPKGSTLLHNPIGTASGIIIPHPSLPKNYLILLPGVPKEMEAITLDSLLPWLMDSTIAPEPRIMQSFCFAHTKESQILELTHSLQTSLPDLKLGIYPAFGYLTLTLSAPQAHQETIDSGTNLVLQEFGERLIGEGDPNLPQWLLKSLKDLNLTLSTAESCTGGSIASAITDIPKASQQFQGSVVSYSNQIKNTVLGVPNETLKTHGAVSSQTVRAMLKGVRKLTKTSCAMATSGILGPGGGTEQKPVGTIWAGYSIQDQEPEIFLIPTRKHWPREIMEEYTRNYLIGHLLITLGKKT